MSTFLSIGRFLLFVLFSLIYIVIHLAILFVFLWGVSDSGASGLLVNISTLLFLLSFLAVALIHLRLFYTTSNIFVGILRMILSITLTFLAFLISVWSTSIIGSTFPYAGYFISFITIESTIAIAVLALAMIPYTVYWKKQIELE